MPLHYQQNINADTRLAVWHITETEAFFLEKVPLSNAVLHPHKRLQHLAGRYLLSCLFPDFPVSSIAIASTRKPFLADEAFHFSISHCGDHAAAIVSRSQRVGIDIENITPRVVRIKEKFLGLSERAAWGLDVPDKASPHSAQAIAQLTLLWSAKEALYKWWGRGELDFQDHMKILPASVAANGQLRAQFLKDNPLDLSLGYRLSDELSLVWLHTPQ